MTAELCVRLGKMTRRTIGPLDKRKNTTRCQSCANRRVKVRNQYSASMRLVKLTDINSVKGVNPAKDASGQIRVVSRSG